MLDQNTDRMWYVIGAVLIGAAIIFGMSSFMPNAFASVSDMFGRTTEQVDKRVSHIGSNANLADPARFEGIRGTTYEYDPVTGISTMTIDARNLAGYRGIQVHDGIWVSHGETLTIEFDIYSDKEYPLLVDLNNLADGLYGNDHRVGGNYAERFTTVPGEWVSVKTSYEPLDTAPEFREKSTIALNSGVVLDEPAVFQLRNIRYTITPTGGE